MLISWRKSYGSQTILILYGGPGETHEAAFKTLSTLNIIGGPRVSLMNNNGLAILHWQVSSARTTIQLDTLTIYLLGK